MGLTPTPATGPPGTSPGAGSPGISPGAGPPGTSPGAGSPGISPGAGPPGTSPGAGPPRPSPGSGAGPGRRVHRATGQAGGGNLRTGGRLYGQAQQVAGQLIEFMRRS